MNPKEEVVSKSTIEETASLKIRSGFEKKGDDVVLGLYEYLFLEVKLVAFMFFSSTRNSASSVILSSWLAVVGKYRNYIILPIKMRKRSYYLAQRDSKDKQLAALVWLMKKSQVDSRFRVRVRVRVRVRMRTTLRS